MLRTHEEQLLWSDLFTLRILALPELEKARQSKAIGKALEAKLSLDGLERTVKSASEQEADFRELVNVSQLEFPNQYPQLAHAVATVRKADGQKCERCWHTETTVGTKTEHPTLCPRCVEAVKQSIAT